MKKKLTLLIFMVSFQMGRQALAQNTAPYLVKATFIISVDDWADIFLNGTPIIDSQRYTPEKSGPQTVTCVPDHLCYFKRENILAVEVSDKSVVTKGDRDVVGIAYVLEMTSSDGKTFRLTSSDAQDQKSFYIGDKMAGEPRGWHYMTFNDDSWKAACLTGPSIPFAATIRDPQTGEPVSFLSSLMPSPDARFPGERHLFRRKFFLNIGNNPDCGKPMQAPRIEPLVVTQPDRRHPVSLPTATATPVPAPSAIFVPPGETNPEPTPTVPPRRAPLRWRLNPTPTPVFTSTILGPEVVRGESTPLTAREIAPSVAENPVPVKAEGQTIVFDRPPANIYMSFADGPGVYRLEVLDKDGRHLRYLYEKKIIAQKEDWAEWDGRDDQGLVCPRGWYFVIYSKDGKLLKKILAGKTAAN